MDPKYTPIEEASRTCWKKQAAEAQERLLKIKATAVEREKRERDAAIKRKQAFEEAARIHAEQQIQARGLVDALIEELGGLEKTHGVKPVSWEAKTIPTNGQMNITVQFARVGEPRTFSPRW